MAKYQEKKRRRYDFRELMFYEDDRLVCINKPVGYSSISERQDANSGLLEMGRQVFPGLRSCHRLDKYTSGALLFARDDETHRYVSRQFQQRKVEKLYHALIAQPRQFDNYMIHAPLGELQKGKARVDPMGKDALTLVSTVESYNRHTLVACKPLTGRSHQVRVHLQHLNCPIVGDALYDGQDLYLSAFKRNYRSGKRHTEHALNYGYLLLAKSLRLVHPDTSKEIVFEADYDENFAVCLKLLRKFDAIPGAPV